MGSDLRPFGEVFADAPRNGLTRPRAVRGTGVKMVNMGELFAHPRLRNAPMDRVPLSESEAERFLLNEGDLLFARQSLVLEGAGKCSLFLKDDEPVTFESHVTRVRLDRRKADSQYYYYYLQSPHGRAAIASIVEQGAGASGIRGSDLETLEVQWCPIDQQRAIAHILGTLDDKIEVNRRMNETLEAIARGLFKSWFVDFDPVRAKAEGRDAGLPKHVADLFPDSFEDSELGEIPRGWRVATVHELAEVNARTLSAADSLDVIDYIEISEVMRGEIRNVPRYQRGTEPSRARRRLRHGDSVVSTVRPDRGAYLLCLNPPETLIASTGFAVLSPRDGNWALLYCALTRPEVGEELGRLADGGAYPAIRPEAIASLTLAMPPRADLPSSFQKLAAPLFGRTNQNRSEAKTLAALRDTLLPKLISGELRVKDAEGFVAAAS